MQTHLAEFTDSSSAHAPPDPTTISAHLKEVQLRLLQLAQAAIWGSGTLIILSLFPRAETDTFIRPTPSTLCFHDASAVIFNTRRGPTME